ncbi:hypothetical protein BDZ89DRAFT_967987, partial [Hymenopellis radicata]
SSTHNTKIERTWVEVGRQFVRLWRAFFYRLERLHGLDRANPFHLWLLHYLFLDEINSDCDKFQEEYNLHPIGGEGHDDTPMDMYLNDLIGAGVHVSAEDFDSVDPAVLQEHYGTEGPERRPKATGAGHASDDVDLEEDTDESMDGDESDEDIDDLDGFPEVPEDEAEKNAWKRLLIGLRDQFLPKPIRAPRKTAPFADNEVEDVFLPLFTELKEQEIIPDGYGLQPAEWEEDFYPSFEILRSGRKGTKELRVALPVENWKPRAEQWGRALHVMNVMIEYNNQEL